MSLSLEDRFKLLLPGELYYRRKVRSEWSRGEPEIRLLDQLISGQEGIAVDVGCNRGIYSYVLAGLCRRVLAFEPNPDMVRFARSKLPRNVEVLEMALGAVHGRAILHIPVDIRGREDHLKASLASAGEASPLRRHEVDVRPLDSFELTRVEFIKIDVEGTELDVLAGAAATIARDRPVLLVELLVGNHDVRSAISAICQTYGYEAFLAKGGGTIAAMPVLDAGEVPSTRNVIFKPVR